MKNILIVQVYNANKGNASVITAMLDGIRRIPDVNVDLTAYAPEKASEEYGIPACERLCDVRRIAKSKGLRKLIAILDEIMFVLYFPLWWFGTRCRIPMPLSNRRRKVIRFYKAADVVVLPDGHSFTSLNGLFGNISHLIGMFAATALHKKTMIYGQTLGPFHGFKGFFEEFWFKRLLKRVDVVTVRDQLSYDTYTHFCSNLYKTAEIVFALNSQKLSSDVALFLSNVRENRRKVFMVTIHHLYYRYFFRRNEYVTLMANCLRETVLKYDLSLVMIPMEDAMRDGGDRKMIHEILDKANLPEDHVFVPEMEISPEETASLIAEADYFTGTKTHSVVYGLKGAVPMIGLAYQNKTREFMRMFDNEKFVIDLKKLTLGEFRRLFDLLVENADEVQTKLQKKRNEIVALALKNNEYLIQLLGLPEPNNTSQIEL